jgi:hypothetical protein
MELSWSLLEFFILVAKNTKPEGEYKNIKHSLKRQVLVC